MAPKDEELRQLLEIHDSLGGQAPADASPAIQARTRYARRGLAWGLA